MTNGKPSNELDYSIDSKIESFKQFTKNFIRHCGRLLRVVRQIRMKSIEF